MKSARDKLIELFEKIDLETVAGPGNLADEVLAVLGLDGQVAYIRDPEHPERLPTAYAQASRTVADEIGTRIPPELRAKFPHAEWVSVRSGEGMFGCEAVISGKLRKAEVSWASDVGADEERLISDLAQQLVA